MNLSHNRQFSLMLPSLTTVWIILVILSGCAYFSEPQTTSPLPPALNSPEDIAQSNLSSWEAAQLYGPQNMSPSGVEFNSPSERTLIGFHTFAVQSGMVITAPYHYLNRESESVHLRLFVLLDEQQIYGGIGYDPDAPYADVIIAPQTEITLPLRLPPMLPGVHNCILISILNPDNPTGLNTSRTTLLAGDTIEFTHPPYTSMPDVDFPLDRTGLFVTNQLETVTLAQDWEASRGKPGEVINYAIYTGYQSPLPDSTAPYNIAILTFINHQQIATQISGDMVFYGQLTPDSIGRHLANVELPHEPGEYNLLVLLIENPHVILKDVVRGPNDPGTGPVSQVFWDVLAHDVIIQVEE